MKKIMNAIDIPADIKFVNGLSSVFFGVFLFLIALNGVEYLIKYKIRNLATITVKGNVLHSDISSIRSHIASGISGNFYTINLITTKQLFESMPWISKAVIKRIYPSQIEVKLSEYKVKAIWGSREDLKIIDDAGLIFEANAEDEEYDQTPQLFGPEGQAKLMLDMHKDISNAISPIGNRLKVLELNARGSWLATLEGGAHMELGRGNTVDVIERIKKFSNSTDQMLTKLNKKTADIQYVDLRHSDGYALRMQGVSTLDTTLANKAIKK